MTAKWVSRLPDPLAPLRQPVFRIFWAANMASALGALIQTVGAAWMMTNLTRSADMVSLIQAASAAPIVMFSIVAGAIADNFDRRKVMLTAQVFLLAVAVLLSTVGYAGLLTPWSLLLFTFLIGVGTALHNPSWQSSLGDLVPKEDLRGAVVLNGMGFNITRGIGPAIGGMIVAAFGPLAAFAVNAASYLGLITALWRWKPPPASSSLPRENLGPAVGAGVRYIAMSPHLQSILVRAFTFGFAVIPVLALLPLVARDHLRGDVLLYGVLFGSFGIGGVAGALISGTLHRKLSPEWTARVAFVGFAISAATLALTPWAALAVPALVLGGGCWVVALTMFNICVQLSTPRWVVGRSLSMYLTASFGGQTLGAWAWGIVADNLGSQAALAIASGTMLLGAGLGIGRWSLPAMSSLNLDPTNRWREPKVEVDILPRSGPIKVMIEYLIQEQDIATFLVIMGERRRTRRRDGARRWSLMRDIENGTKWIESYHFPTWLDYVRYNQRVTLADSGISERLRDLHSGDGPPLVHRMIERPTIWQPSNYPPGLH